MREHTIEEISSKLYLDKKYLEAILTFDDAEINTAIMKANKEKVLTEKMDFLTQNFSYTYLFEKGPRNILIDYFELNKRKKSLLDTVQGVLDLESDGYFTFSSDTLDLISVNTVINYDKTPYSLEQIKSLEALKNVSDGIHTRNDINTCSEIFGERLTSEELSLTSSTGYLTLGLEHSKSLINFVMDHSLPIIYNQIIFDSCVDKEKIGKRCVTYIKK